MAITLLLGKDSGDAWVEKDRPAHEVSVTLLSRVSFEFFGYEFRTVWAKPEAILIRC